MGHYAHGNGGAKELENEQFERRAAGLAGYVCDECFSDYALIAYVKEHATENECDFCGRKEDRPIAAPADDVVGLIMESIRTEWTDPVEELAYDSAEGGYQGHQIEFDQVLYEVGEPIAGDEFREALIAATIGYTIQWCKADYGAPFEDEAMAYDWSDLVDHVKFQSRYFFSTQVREGREAGQHGSAVDILTDIKTFAEAAGLFRTISAGGRFWRARASEAAGAFGTPDELGTPPPEVALSSNRMSPAGIPAFYGAEDPDTAIEEIRTVPVPELGAYWSAGEFALSGACLVLDLATMPDPPSIFDSERALRRPLYFLSDFATDISKPLGARGREHIDYVPTQVVAEFLRLSFVSELGPVAGVRYRSARHDGGTCVVLFIPNEDCVDEASGDHPQLVLGEVRHGEFSITAEASNHPKGP
ncbi:MAG TPA: HEPN-associated N-terminal domain-containing protein [Solirubrobacterales bacterium]